MKYSVLAVLLTVIFFCRASSLEEIFTSIFNNHSWGGGKETVSGSGSTLLQTSNIRAFLPQLLKELDIKVVLDAACGDFNWMSKIDLSGLELYIGVDIVNDLILHNKKLYEKNNVVFYHKDVSRDFLPSADLILCRDLFLHLKYEDIFNVLKNFKRNKAKYILMSTYANITLNVDRDEINSGYRPVNLELPPFNFPKPLLLIDDFKSVGKFMGLWQMEMVPDEYQMKIN